MWKPEHRLTADRRSLRYPSDLSDAEWGLIAPMIPPARRCGRRRSVVRTKCTAKIIAFDRATIVGQTVFAIAVECSR